jgi:hypothetical protein
MLAKKSGHFGFGSVNLQTGLRTLMHNHGAADLRLFPFTGARRICRIVVFRFCPDTKIRQLFHNSSNRGLCCHANNCNWRKNCFLFFIQSINKKWRTKPDSPFQF